MTDDSGKKLDSSDGAPLAYLHGNGNLIPGLERELEGKSAGDKLSVKIAAADLTANTTKHWSSASPGAHSKASATSA